MYVAVMASATNIIIHHGLHVAATLVSFNTYKGVHTHLFKGITMCRAMMIHERVC